MGSDDLRKKIRQKLLDRDALAAEGHGRGLILPDTGHFRLRNRS
jgi:hypothetical protein